jgi:hypothetical protein
MFLAIGFQQQYRWSSFLPSRMLYLFDSVYDAVWLLRDKMRKNRKRIMPSSRKSGYFTLIILMSYTVFLYRCPLVFNRLGLFTCWSLLTGALFWKKRFWNQAVTIKLSFYQSLHLVLTHIPSGRFDKSTGTLRLQGNRTLEIDCYCNTLDYLDPIPTCFFRLFINILPFLHSSVSFSGNYRVWPCRKFCGRWIYLVIRKCIHCMEGPHISDIKKKSIATVFLAEKKRKE